MQKKNQFIIITNDDDFMRLLISKGYPPKIIILRIGNQSNDNIFQLLCEKKKEISSFVKSEDYGLLEIY